MLIFFLFFVLVFAKPTLSSSESYVIYVCKKTMICYDDVHDVFNRSLISPWITTNPDGTEFLFSTFLGRKQAKENEKHWSVISRLDARK